MRPKRLEAIAYSKDRFDINVRMLPQLSPQPADIYVQRARSDLVAVAPDLLQQIRPRNDLAGVLHQHGQKFVFLAREAEALHIERDGLALEIQVQMRILIVIRLATDSLKQ